MTSQKDIIQIILLMQAAFPNYHPGKGTPEALYQFLQDLPGDTLKAAVLAACTEPGREFAPSAGEIRATAIELSIRALGIPNEFEAWAEVCGMPKNMLRRQVAVDAAGDPVTNERGAAIILEERLHWSHALVERTAGLLGWPEFPGKDESLDRAHFLQAYRAELSRMVEQAGELPAVRKYVEARRGAGPQLIGQELKKLAAAGRSAEGSPTPLDVNSSIDPRIAEPDQKKG